MLVWPISAPIFIADIYFERNLGIIDQIWKQLFLIKAHCCCYILIDRVKRVHIRLTLP